MTEIDKLMTRIADQCRGAFLLDRVINRLRAACDGYFTRRDLEQMIREQYDVYQTPSGPAIRGWWLRPTHAAR